MDNSREREPQYYADIIAALAEKTIKRLWIALIVAYVLIAGLAGGFLWYLNQYDFQSISTEYTQDGRGLNVIGANSLNGVNLNGADLQNDDCIED